MLPVCLHMQSQDHEHMLCYVYVNCVLGYEHICQVNMLHVFSCTFLHKNNIQTKTNNTGYPAHEPPRKINISKGLAGRFLFFLFFLFSFEFFFFFCFYMCFFDCKCKSLKRLGENIKNNRKKHKKNRKTRRKTEKTKIQDIQPTNFRE